jgi:hypothetical protein
VSAAEGSADTQPVYLSNLTDAILPVMLRLDFSYLASAAAAAGETALAQIALSVSRSDTPAPVFSFNRSVVFNGSESMSNSIELDLNLPPASEIGIVMHAETRGEAASIPESCGMLPIALSVLIGTKFLRSPAG